MRTGRGRTTVFAAVIALAMPPLLSALGKPRQGTFLCIPYSFERPTWARLGRSVWDPTSRSILTPHVYGWGYGVNLHALARRLSILAA